ncbi:hypothetical protein BGZ93_002581 [Podila epicladia]|nr:hypothetical protein BGZ92_004950 [Podila epicladia]KAG0097526.1 hypothetical protein BGZ93_002581 [Podila epicladia]
MNPSHSSYVEYGTGNMLNIDAGTIKRKIDSNEYDDEIIQEVQPNGKRACGANHPASQFATFGSTPHTPSGPEHHQHAAFNGTWAQSNPSPLLRTAVNHAAGHPHLNNPTNSESLTLGYHTPESVSSHAGSPSTFQSMDTDMDMDSTPSVSQSPMMQNTNAMLHTTLAAPLTGATSHHHNQAPMVSNGLLPSALPVQEAPSPSTGSNEYVPVHGRSMEIPSYARVPMNEMRKYRDQRWSSCIYGADARIGQGMMI